MTRKKGEIGQMYKRTEDECQIVLALIGKTPMRTLQIAKTANLSDNVVHERLRILDARRAVMRAQIGEYSYWAAVGTKAEQTLVQRKAEHFAGKAQRIALQKRKYRAKLRGYEVDQRQDDFSWLYPVKRTVTEWKATIPPRAVRSVFELGRWL